MHPAGAEEAASAASPASLDVLQRFVSLCNRICCFTLLFLRFLLVAGSCQHVAYGWTVRHAQFETSRDRHLALHTRSSPLDHICEVDFDHFDDLFSSFTFKNEYRCNRSLTDCGKKVKHRRRAETKIAYLPVFDAVGRLYFPGRLDLVVVMPASRLDA